MPFEIDTLSFPLVVIRYPDRADLSDIDTYAEQLERVVARGKLATIVDLRPIGGFLASRLVLAPGIRKHLAAHIDRITHTYPEHLISEAVIVDSTIIRGAYTAYQWLRSDSSYESRAFTDFEAAEKWSLAKLQTAGMISQV